MKRTIPYGAALALAVFLAIMAAGCGEEECALCPVCPSCTLVTSFEIEPVVDGCVLDGIAPAMKDGLGDWVLSNSMLIARNNESSIREHHVEARGIMEFGITSITGTLEEAFLELALDKFENMPRNLPIVLCSYIGNGDFRMFDFNLGQPVDTVVYNYQWTVTFDVADVIRSHIAAGDTCAGFNIRIDPPTHVETGGPAVYFRSTSAGPPPRLKITQQEIVEP